MEIMEGWRIYHEREPDDAPPVLMFFMPFMVNFISPCAP
jgi:hypothetical protein